jgi:hypothetical protein
LCAHPSKDDRVVAKGTVVVSGIGAGESPAVSVTVTSNAWVPSACVITLLTFWPAYLNHTPTCSSPQNMSPEEFVQINES